MSPPTNLFENLRLHLPDEQVTTLLEAGQVRIERIVSQGHASAEGYWYDQVEDEWVMVVRGEAIIRFENVEQPVRMKAGDHLNIPAHMRHRVEWTTPVEPSIWLAVFYGGKSGEREDETNKATKG